MGSDELPARSAPDEDDNAIVLFICPPLTRADIPGLCERLRLLVLLNNRDRDWDQDFDPGAEVVTADVAALGPPDMVTVEALVRLQLTARRLGHRLQLRHAGGALRNLLTLVGLGDVLPLCPRGQPLIEAGGQAEQREQPLGVQELVEPDDPVA